MSTSYLDLTNELLRELNEVTLTSGNFTTAIGVQQHVKDSLNRAYFDIINEEPQWPFLSAAESGDVDPMYGNTYVETVAGTRFYELKPASDNITTDYGSIDWDNFYITTVGVNGETAPYTGNNLSFMTTETWKTFRRVSENLDDAGSQAFGVPNSVIRSPDSRKFGLSPIPDKVYKVWFYAWVLPTKLAAYSDTLVFPEMYSSVLLARARYYIWQFKDNPQAAAFAMEDYKKGLRSMRSNLIESAPTIIQDDRVRFV
jgi:hypothetical protein|tara:strand:+ start:3465 stop:4235 length:771 start_codon:yes stop_codon:yes gene_type:complete